MDLLICLNLLPQLHCRTTDKIQYQDPKGCGRAGAMAKVQISGSVKLFSDPACGPATLTQNFTKKNPLLKSPGFSSEPTYQNMSVRMERRQRREGIIVTEGTGEKPELERFGSFF